VNFRLSRGFRLPKPRERKWMIVQNVLHFMLTSSLAVTVLNVNSVQMAQCKAWLSNYVEIIGHWRENHGKQTHKEGKRFVENSLY